MRYLAVFFSGAAQLIIFAMVMMVAAFFMLRDENSAEDGEDADSPGGYAGRMVLRLAAPGIAVGLLTGLVGVGGGFLIVPTLVLLAEVPMETAVGTSLLVIAMNSAAGFAGYLGGVEVRWTVVAAFTALAVGGSFAGTYLAARFLSGMALRRGFAVFLVLMAIFILYQNREALPFG